MKRVFFLLIFLIANYHLTAQITGFVKDGTSHQSIPYVNIWVENENTGTSGDENGKFTLPAIDSSKTLVFSAMGYHTMQVSVSKGVDTVYLKSKAIKLAEAVFIPKKGISERTIGDIDKKDADTYFANSTRPWIVAKFLPYSDEYKETPYLKSIKIITDSEIKNAKFNVRLYGVDTAGMPGEFLYNYTILGYAKKRIQITEIDLSNLEIQFPRDGFFVAIECLIIEENKHVERGTEVDIDGTETKKKVWVHYQPFVGAAYRDTNENTWYYSQGKWYKFSPTHFLRTIPEYAEEAKKFEGKLIVIPMELVLTD